MLTIVFCDHAGVATRNNVPSTINFSIAQRETTMKRVKLSREHAKIHARLREIRWNYFNQGNELAAAFNCEPRNFVSSRDETLLCAKDLLWKDMSGFWKSRLTSDVNPWCNSSNRLSSPKDQIILWKKTFSKNRENTKGFLNDQKFRFRQVPRN